MLMILTILYVVHNLQRDGVPALNPGLPLLTVGVGEINLIKLNLVFANTYLAM